MKSTTLKLLMLAILTLATFIIIAYGRGYRFNLKEKKISGTGLLVAKSKPDGAQVFINGELKTATNATLNLTPGKHSVRITKEGFQPWKKQIKIYEEVVAKAEPILFPASPGLSPLTSSGVLNPAISPDGSSIAFLKRNPEATTAATLKRRQTLLKQSGIYVLNLQSAPLSFSTNPHQIASGDQFPISNPKFQISLIWSPDGEKLLTVFNNKENNSQAAYILNSNDSNSTPRQTPSLAETLSLWEEQEELELQSKIRTFPEELIPVATSSAEIISFSPNESKILYEATAETTIPEIITPPLIGVNPTRQTRAIKPDNLYVYDLKEDRNYLLGPADEFQISNFKLTWFPTSRHLLFVEDQKIKIMEYDSSNKTTLYAGPFKDNFITPWPDGSKLVILTTLNPDAAGTLNLYALKLR